MDDIFEHLGIILLIVISVVAQIVKTAKKAAKSSGMPTEETNGHPTYEDIIKEIRKPRSEKRTITAPMTANKKKKVKKSSETEIKSNPAAHTAIEKSNDKSADTEILKQSNTIDDFDLRKAVIYSEILTPKFKEE